MKDPSFEKFHQSTTVSKLPPSVIEILKVAELGFLVGRGTTSHILIRKKLREIKKRNHNEVLAGSAFPPKSTNDICVNKYCIPVGCVPSTAVAVPGGMSPSGGVCLGGGLPRGVFAQGGVCPGEYLPDTLRGQNDRQV